MLLLPLLGGYIFVRHWNYTKIHVLRSDKDRLLIRASLSGLFSLMLAYSLSIVGALLFPCNEGGFCIPSLWYRFIPFEYSGVSFAAFLIAATAWYPLNHFYSLNGEIDRAIKEDLDPFELLLKRAQDEGIAVSITMGNDKIYIGLITHQFNPATPTNYIGILPLQSGYRDADTKRMNLTTDYSQAQEQITQEIDDISAKIIGLKNERKKLLETLDKETLVTIERQLEDSIEKWEQLEKRSNLFELVLPVSQISSVNFFDVRVREKYFPILDKVESIIKM